MEVDIHRLSNFFFHIKKEKQQQKNLCADPYVKICVNTTS